MKRLGVIAVFVVSAATSSLGLQSSNEERQRMQPDGCPYHFQSDMPPGVYCVYRGTAVAGDGEVCADDVVLIWSTHGQRGEPAYGSDDGVVSNRDVYVGFVGDPVLVVRASAAHAELAKLVDYRFSSDVDPTPVSGFTALNPSNHGRRALTFAVRPPGELARDGDACSFAFYGGNFVGVIGYPDGAAAHHD